MEFGGTDCDFPFCYAKVGEVEGSSRCEEFMPGDSDRGKSHKEVARNNNIHAIAVEGAARKNVGDIVDGCPSTKNQSKFLLD